ncbi:hypothetical protein NT05HA_0101 [Aggregatibacter aphrophilus NJ8700]|nr:hypothetical protein NT05HA_0101 [Aggregatibacter aphrophilus NJ8700]
MNKKRNPEVIRGFVFYKTLEKTTALFLFFSSDSRAFQVQSTS